MNKINKTLAIAILFSPAPAGLEPLGAERCPVCYGTGLGLETFDYERHPGVVVEEQPQVFGCHRCEEGTSRLDILLDGLGRLAQQAQGFVAHREADEAVDLFILQNEQELFDRLVGLGVSPVCGR